MSSRPTSPAYGPAQPIPDSYSGATASGTGRISGPLRDDPGKLNDPRDEALQWDIFHRLQQVNLQHASAAWRYRYSMPIAPHALAFLYGQPGQRQRRYQTTVTAATRLWDFAPESEHPIPLLTKLTDVAREHATPDSAVEAGSHGLRPEPAPIWDLRDELADRYDATMTADAEYLGLGYSTLNTRLGSFADVCQSAMSELNVPGAFYFVTNPSGDLRGTDHRAFTAERQAAADHHTITIQSWQAFTTAQIVSPQAYQPVDMDYLYRLSPYAAVLQAMWRLDQALRATDTARLQAQASRGNHRRGPE